MHPRVRTLSSPRPGVCRQSSLRSCVYRRRLQTRVWGRCSINGLNLHPQGDQGLAGFPGSPGEKGEKGSTGIPGMPGAPGPKGSPGSVGYPGKWASLLPSSGSRGGKEKLTVTGTGCSAFSLGSPGLPGEKGDKGLPGLDGIPGIKGEAGRNHISGHVGARGGRSCGVRLGNLWMTCGVTPPPPVE